MKCWQVIFPRCSCRAKLNLAGCNLCLQLGDEFYGHWQNGWVENQALLLLPNSQARRKWQWFKHMLDRPYVLYSELKWWCVSVLLNIRTTAPASRTAGRSPMLKKCTLPKSFKSHLGMKPVSVLAHLMLERDVLGRHSWCNGVDTSNIFQLYKQPSSKTVG